MKLPYIIAEVGLNHGGDYEVAVSMIETAAIAGADAVKFQYVKADRLVSKSAQPYFQQIGEPAETQHAFFSRSDALDRGDYERLAKVCAGCGVDFLCTVFDVESVHWVAPLVPAFKVASADITNQPLLEAIRGYVHENYSISKNIYISTGAASQSEINETRTFFNKTPNVSWLHCVLSYPTPPHLAGLGVMQGLPCPFGYSDHTLFNLDVLTTAWLLGASVIEKHFTLDKTLLGNDHYHSMDPNDLRALIAKLKELQAMIGDGEKRVLPIEEPARANARQSWHAVRDLPAGHILTADDVVLKRPADGLAPGYPIIGKRLAYPIATDAPIQEMFEHEPTPV